MIPIINKREAATEKTYGRLEDEEVEVERKTTDINNVITAIRMSIKLSGIGAEAIIEAAKHAHKTPRINNKISLTMLIIFPF